MGLGGFAEAVAAIGEEEGGEQVVDDDAAATAAPVERGRGRSLGTDEGEGRREVGYAGKVEETVEAGEDDGAVV